MRDDIKNYIESLSKEEISLINKAKLARRFGCDPRTVGRYLKIKSGELIPKSRARIYLSKLEDYKELIISKIDDYDCTAMAVYKLICKKGYRGKYTIVADFVRKHRATETKKATIRFETHPGLQAQVDWKEDMTLINRQGQAFKVNIFLMVMGCSRKKFIKITSDRSQETLFNCMISAFEYYGGLTHEILFDNMKTVVDRAKSSFTQAVFNARFKAFAKDMGFTPIACRPYRPQTKGKAEALAKLMDRLKAYNEEFDTWDDLVAISEEFLKDINQEVSQGIDDIPDILFEKEKEYLLPLPNTELLQSYLSRQEEKTYLVNRESMITYEGRKYSVPTCYIGERMTVATDENGNLKIYYNTKLVISHAISSQRYNYTLETAHEILKSDAMKNNTDAEIQEFIKNNLMKMDICIGGL